MNQTVSRTWRGLCAGISGLWLLGGNTASAGDIDLGLQEVMQAGSPDQPVSVLVYLRDQIDFDALVSQFDAIRAPNEMRHQMVVTALQEQAHNTQAPLYDYLKRLEMSGQVSQFGSLWIVNGFHVDTKLGVVQQIANQPSVGTVYYNYAIEGIHPLNPGKAVPADPAQLSTPENGLTVVKAPDVWAIGIDGTGMLVSSLDTGVDGSHPALASRWAGLDPLYSGHPGWAFFDPVTHANFPFDSGIHGTHTMGTICGGSPGDSIGVAPGSHWINAAVIDRVSLTQTCTDALLAWQWLIDPDGNPATFWDVPQVNSNSWGIATSHNIPPYSTPCDSSFWSAVDACEAAGTVLLFAAGNEGSTGLRRPADRATNDYQNCAVGAIDGHTAGYPVASFSSTGPTNCTPGGGSFVKPNISAPGVSVRSSEPGNTYGLLDGTSMATPHIAGVVALIRQACPSLTVNQVKQIIYSTAQDLAPTGKDNSTGWGLVNAYAAVQMAFSMCGPHPPTAFDVSSNVAVNTPTTITLTAQDYDHGPQAMVYIVTDLPTYTLADVGNGHVITAGDLPYTLVNNGNQLTYTPGTGYYGTDSFHFKANDGGVPPDGGDSNVATVSILVKYGPPVITTTTLPSGRVNHPYGPFQMTASEGQPALTWQVLNIGPYLETNLGSSQFTVVGTAQNWRADDSSWPYTLPFSFPYFGTNYSTVNVCSNGFLDFTSTDANWQNSDPNLIIHARVAALWDDLRTDQTGTDIYVLASPSSVTFRWQAVTYSALTPVNVSMTLFPDGRIRFHYGSGNTGLTPTVGLSSGNGTIYTLSSYNNATSLTNANSHEFLPPQPLPAGMSLSGAGVLGGKPTVTGTFSPIFVVTDSLGRSNQKSLSLLIRTDCPNAGASGAHCTGDIDGTGDCIVGLSDLSTVLSHYGESSTTYDLNNDGVVGLADITILLSQYGDDCN